MPFTESDDESLCYYIARILPDKAAGGRLGLGIYKMLVEMVGTYVLTRCFLRLTFFSITLQGCSEAFTCVGCQTYG